MMPTEGTFMHWFLTSRMLHVAITMTILLSLVLSTPVLDFYYTTPYLDLLPEGKEFWSGPLTFLRRNWEVYQMHVDYTSAQTAEKRRQKVEDVRKRSEYRKAHGLEGQEGIFGGWTAKSDEEVLGPGMREGPGVGEMQLKTAVAPPSSEEQRVEDGTYVDFEGNRQTARKKWFGIW
jgi:hypothetical protein